MLGYRQRWFRLKGNLLFYFKVDELQDWEVSEGGRGVKEEEEGERERDE